MLRLLRRKDVVGISLVSSRVYVSRPTTVHGVEDVVVVGTPVPFAADAVGVGASFSVSQPNLVMPAGCSPDFGSGEYYTAQHCIGSKDAVDVIDGSLAKVGEAKAVRKNHWRRFGFFCAVLSVITGKLQCVNKDWAVIDIGNPGDNPVAVLSGGTVPPGFTFFAPLTDSPKSLIGKKLYGTSFDYDAKKFVVNEWEVFDYGVVKYVVEGSPYVVEVLFAKGFSKPGFSGTNAYIVAQK